MNTFHLITFESTNYAMKVESLLCSVKKAYMIPTPREIHASCGLSIRIDSEDISEITEMFEKENLDKNMYQIYLAEGEKNQKTYSKLINA